VNRRARAQQDPLSWRELLLPQQASEAKERIRCHQAPLAHDVAGFQLDPNVLGHAATLARKPVDKPRAYTQP